MEGNQVWSLGYQWQKESECQDIFILLDVEGAAHPDSFEHDAPGVLPRGAFVCPLES
jgi:hypothetical protein